MIKKLIFPTVFFFFFSCSNDKSGQQSQTSSSVKNKHIKTSVADKHSDKSKTVSGKNQKTVVKTSAESGKSLILLNPKYPSGVKPFAYDKLKGLKYPAVSLKQLVDFLKKNQINDWYGLYMSKHKVGYLNQRWYLSEDSLKVLHSEVFHMEMKVLGQVKIMDINTNTTYDAISGEMISLISSQKVGPAVKTESLIRTDKNSYKLSVETKTGGINSPASNKYEKDLKENPGLLQNSELAQMFVISGLKTAKSLPVWKLRQFSPVTLRVSDAAFRVLSSSERIISGIKTTVFTVELINGDPQSRMLAVIDKSGSLIVGAKGSIVLKREDKKQAKSLSSNFDVGFAAVIRADLSDLNPRSASTITLNIKGKYPESLNYLNLNRYSLQKSKTGLSLVLKKDDLKGLKKVKISDLLKPFVKEEHGLEINNPLIKQLALKAVKGIKNPVKQVEKLTFFVSDYVQDTMRSDLDSALMIAKVKRGDCTEHSLLLTALLRSLGFPARQVGGVAYIETCSAPNCLKGFAYHAWVQVYLGRWIDIDPTWRQFPADVTHVMMGTEKQLDWLESLGNIKLIPVTKNK